VSERILLVEDDRAIADAVEYALGSEGFEVTVIDDGNAAARAPHDAYDLVLLDLMLPGLSGLEVCRRIRDHSIVPVVMLTARTAEVDRVLGLEAGADDYIPKPFSMPELVSRVRAVLRRRMMDREAVVATSRTVGSLRLDLIAQEVRVGDRAVDVTPSEFRLLALLAGDPERAFSRREIIEHLWRSTHVGDERVCDVHVKNLRRKLERDPARPERLVTVRGVGYMLRAASTPLLEAALDRAIRTGVASVVADLGAVTFLDSAGLSTLLTCAQKLRMNGGELVVVTDDPRIVGVLERSRLDVVVRLERSLTEALRQVLPRPAVA
jgi:anti-anti-sigma factor